MEGRFKSMTVQCQADLRLYILEQMGGPVGIGNRSFDPETFPEQIDAQQVGSRPSMLPNAAHTPANSSWQSLGSHPVSGRPARSSCVICQFPLLGRG